MSNDAQYMPFYVAKYLADTAHLSTLAHGSYLLLIMNYWQRGKPLPDDERKLASIARLTVVEWTLISGDIREYFQCRDGLLYHDKVEIELDRVKGKIDAARRAGHASAAAKSVTKSMQDQQPINERSTDVEQMPNHKVRLGKEERKKETRAGALDLSLQEKSFEEFWEIYPNKVGMTVAFKAWKTTITRDSVEAIMAGTRRYAGKADDRAWLNPAKFLNESRWRDEPAQVKPAYVSTSGNSPPIDFTRLPKPKFIQQFEKSG